MSNLTQETEMVAHQIFFQGITYSKTKEQELVEGVLDQIKEVIKYAECPEGQLSRKVLRSLVETLPVRTNHLFKLQ